INFGSSALSAQPSSYLRVRLESQEPEGTPEELTVVQSAVARPLHCDMLGVVPVSPTNLELFCVTPGWLGWQHEALRCFRRHGFVIVKGALQTGLGSPCETLLSACLTAESELAAMAVEASEGQKPLGSRGAGRMSFGNASKTGSLLHNSAWAQLLDCGPLLDIVDLLLPGGGECVVGGGDFVKPRTEKYQQLHSDLASSVSVGSFDNDFPPPYLSANFVVQPIRAENGPMRIIPGTQRLSESATRNQFWLPCVGEGSTGDQEPLDWQSSVLQPLEAGDLILRDVRVLHGGTPNLSETTRFLPALEFVLSSFKRSSIYSNCWTTPGIPEDVKQKLSRRAQYWLPRDLVRERNEMDLGWRS
ncbi:unnamed protein product, partial [Polarella glacialis]